MNILKAILLGAGLGFVIWFLFMLDATESVALHPITTEDSNDRAAHYHGRSEDSLSEDTTILNHSRIPCPGDSPK